MLVSWNWLKQYVPLDVSPEEFERRVMLAGLNHEETTPVDGDLAIDLEITSNRPDCLGHIGVAREAAVLFGKELKLPLAAPRSGTTPIGDLTKVELRAPEVCYRYTARVIRGAKVKPSPDWMVKRLATIGIAAINNIVDITNYVLMECGQPLHAFDLGRLAGRQVVVREAAKGEKLVAINHKEYELEPGMCVIADRDRAVALGGVMGGAETEVDERTSDILLEAAEFDPLSIRTTARRLNLYSPSSYRFERGLDPEGVDWASRRACELILELAGGELAAGVIDVGRRPDKREQVTLRISQLKRILGIDIEPSRARGILAALGNEVLKSDATSIEVIPPSWRRDLTREIDLVEEVARIHGYDAIPEDVTVPMATSARTRQDRVLSKIRHVLTSAGYDEALTLSVVEQEWSEAFSPWTDASPLVSDMPIVRGADRLRRSLVPSLLGARRTNQSLANPRIELFEIARTYLARRGQLPNEELMLAISSGGDYLSVKGVLEELLEQLKPGSLFGVTPTNQPLLDRSKSSELTLNGEVVAYVGEVSEAGRKQFDLRAASTVAEVRLGPLIAAAELVPQYRELVAYPAVSRDLNLVVDEAVRWADLAATARQAAGPLLESLTYQDTYRDPQRLGPGKKSLLLSISLRSSEGTLTNEEADRVREQVVAASSKAHGAQLRA